MSDTETDWTARFKVTIEDRNGTAVVVELRDRPPRSFNLHWLGPSLPAAFDHAELEALETGLHDLKMNIACLRMLLGQPERRPVSVPVSSSWLMLKEPKG